MMIAYHLARADMVKPVEQSDFKCLFAKPHAAALLHAQCSLCGHFMYQVIGCNVYNHVIARRDAACCAADRTEVRVICRTCR